jgi:outer membrane protein OmpA-like peptidoglycan-associated protein
MTSLRAFGLAGVLLTGTVLAASAALGQTPGYLTAPGQYSFPVLPGAYMDSHWVGGDTSVTPTALGYDVNAGCYPTPVNYMSPHYAGADGSGGPYFTANCPGAFPVAPGSYMSPWYMPGAMASMASGAAAGPAAAVAPARSYLVFFDWDRATLTVRARQIIKEAADNSTRVQYTSIVVNGYTDTSGTPQYNQGLSIRRADAVKAELLNDGVPVAAIATQGFGETHLLVSTGPGVREPQNRRVEIIIR